MAGRRRQPTRRAVLAALPVAGLGAVGSPHARVLKPRVPPGRHPGGVTFAVIGAGVAYTRPEIAARLARDGEGELIGWDFEDDDRLPLELVPGRSATRLAEIVLAEDGATSLAPLRVRPGDGEAVARAVRLCGQTPARVVLIGDAAADALTSPKEAGRFLAALGAARDLLAILAWPRVETGPAPTSPPPAGNVLTVVPTAADGARLAGVNVAEAATELAVAVGEGVHPAETAAARVTALATRLVAVEPDLRGASLKARILSLARPNPSRAAPQARAGWIGEPHRPFRLE